MLIIHFDVIGVGSESSGSVPELRPPKIASPTVNRCKRVLITGRLTSSIFFSEPYKKY